METTGLNPNTAQNEQFDSQSQETMIENSSTPTTEPQSSTASEELPQDQTMPQSIEAEVLDIQQDDQPHDQPHDQTIEQSDDSETSDAQTQDSADAQEEANQEAEQKESPTPNDYSSKSRAELVELLIQAIQTRAVVTLRSTVEALKVAFYKVPRPEVEAQKEAFIAAGGALEDFKATEDPLEVRFKEAINTYRVKRDAYMAGIEDEKSNNLALKLAIIEELKELSNSSETLNNTFTAFRELQTRWREIGSVPQEKVKDLWDTYHHHVENFYNFVKINKELRDIDLKRNFEAKVELCEQAEALMMDPSATSAFHSLQKLHEQWREIGPVATESKEQIWDRFKEASARVNKRHQEYFDRIKEEQLRNLSLKQELCLKVEELATQPFTTRKEWGDASDQIAEIQKIWKTIGFAPKKDNTKIYERFRAACDGFFEAKRNFFGGVKSEMEENLQAKVELCIQAEALSDSEEWKKATDQIIELQKLWKETGPTSRKHADEVWKRFRAACDKFFERKAEHFSSVDSKFNENLEAKKQLLAELGGLLKQEAKVTFDILKDYQRRWSEIGFVPIKQKEAIAKQYKEIVDELFTMLRGTERDRKMDNFRGKLSSMKEGGARRINSERERFITKMRQVEADIQLWENNIGFFAKSKNAEALVGQVRKKIEQAKAEIAETLEKIRIIDAQEQDGK